MESRTGKAVGLKDAIRAAGAIMILLLFPYPLALLFVVGVRDAWVYLVVYISWATFVVFIVWLSFRVRSGRPTKWPHRRVMWIPFAGLLLQYALTRTVLQVGAAVNWFIFIVLTVWFLVEGALGGQYRKASRTGVQGTKTR